MIGLFAGITLLCFVQVRGQTFEQRIEKYTRLSAINQQAQRTTTDRRRRIAKHKSGSQPMFDWYDEAYVGNITIGTPGQLFTVDLDTGSANLWVVGCACKSQACRGNPKSGYAKHCYAPSASTTYRPNGEPLSIQYGEGSFNGSLASDVVNFGGLTDLDQTFGIATAVDDDFGDQQVDGILGLGWPPLAEDNVTPPLFRILGQLDQPIFTVWLDRHVKPSAGRNGGQITYGAVDTKNCDAQVDYVPLTAEVHWQFNIDSFSVGTKAFDKQQQVLSDTGTSWLAVQHDVFDAIVAQTDAEYNFRQDMYTLACDAPGLPDLVFAIGGNPYNVGSKEYVIDLNLGHNECVLAVRPFSWNHPDPANPTMILGDVFIRAYCNVYDMGRKRIGFAKAHHGEI